MTNREKLRKLEWNTTLSGNYHAKVYSTTFKEQNLSKV